MKYMYNSPIHRNRFLLYNIYILLYNIYTQKNKLIWYEIYNTGK